MKKQIVIFDIDGTLTKVGSRLAEIQGEKKDWVKFYQRCGEDDPNQKILNLAQSLQEDENYEVIFLTGRAKYEGVEEATMIWLRSYGLKIKDYGFGHRGFSGLIMRKANDRRPDTVVKPELLDKWLSHFDKTKEDVDIIFEDRNSMVNTWRQLGFTCAQVAEGDF